MKTEEKVNEWFEWHKDWKIRYVQAKEEINYIQGYGWGEKQTALKDIEKIFMKQMWDNRKRILGY